VRPGEGDHVVSVEALGGEEVGERVEVTERAGQVVRGLVGERHAPVEAAGGHREGAADPAAAEHAGRVAGGEREGVGARDDARARRLQRRLGRVDHLEAAEAVHVGEAEHLRLLAGGAAARVPEEDGGVAAPDEAVVEEEADEPRARAGVFAHRVLHDLPHDVFRVGARVAVAAVVVVADLEN